MSEVFRIVALPASDGDCLIVEWGDAGDLRRMVVDGGRGAKALTGWLKRLPVARRTIDLLVVTHLDADHIAGVLGLLNAPPDGLTVGEVWFNDRRHLPDDQLGFGQAVRLAEILDEWTAAGRTTWNAAWSEWQRQHGYSLRDAVVVPDDANPLPSVDVHGLTVTLLSPGPGALAALAQEWDEWALAAEATAPPAASTPAAVDDDVLGLVDDDADVDLVTLSRRNFSPDTEPPNGSSIAFLAEFGEHRILLTGDAHVDALTNGLQRVAGGRSVKVDVCKLAHHGSAGNTSPDLLELLDCETWLVSTSGAYHRHPHRRTIARLVTRYVPTRLAFNYLRPTTREWADPHLQATHAFDSVHPPEGQPGIALDVLTGEARPLDQTGAI